MEHDFKIVHVAGVKHHAADKLSQVPIEITNYSDINGDNPTLSYAKAARRTLSRVANNTSGHMRMDKRLLLL